MMPAIASKTESFRSKFLRQSDRGSPPRARALHGLGQLIRKSALCAVRTDRRNGGHAIGDRPSPRRRELSRATSRWCWQTSIFSLQLHIPSPPRGACATQSTGARNGIRQTAKQHAQLRVRHGPLAHQEAQYFNQNMSPNRPAHTHNRRKTLHM